jgi:hypothetical protein
VLAANQATAFRALFQVQLLYNFFIFAKLAVIDVSLPRGLPFSEKPDAKYRANRDVG